MIAVLQALGLGLLIGATFAVVRLDVPAPATLAGIAGVVGLWAGWAALSWILNR